MAIALTASKSDETDSRFMFCHRCRSIIAALVCLNGEEWAVRRAENGRRIHAAATMTRKPSFTGDNYVMLKPKEQWGSIEVTCKCKARSRFSREVLQDVAGSDRKSVFGVAIVGASY